MKVKAYRYPNCVVCVRLVNQKQRKTVHKGKLYREGLGPVCSYHFHQGDTHV